MQCVRLVYDTIPLSYSPGSGFYYCGIHLQVAAAMALEAVKQPYWNSLYAEQVQLRLATSSCPDPRFRRFAIRSTSARRRSSGRRAIQSARAAETSNINIRYCANSVAGGLLISPNDHGKWIHAYYTGQLLKPATTATMEVDNTQAPVRAALTMAVVAIAG